MNIELKIAGSYLQVKNVVYIKKHYVWFNFNEIVVKRYTSKLK